jgi:signal transduction histidine kinase
MKIIKSFLFLMFLSNSVVFGQKKEPLAQITAVKLGNNYEGFKDSGLKISKNEAVRLQYSQNYLHFVFENKKNPKNRVFYYWMDGLDYTWIKCEDCNQVQYAHLNAGEYTFLVKTGEKGDVPAKFKFKVEGNIVNKWWFIPMLFTYALIFLGILVYFYILFRFRQKLVQQRLIHQEKMTSMAELTAGIAHEIQNPLNFVNNFSEVSLELLEELKSPLSPKGGIEEQELLSDISQNLEKINYHGKRASSIVKGMLEHSRTSSGVKELTDINKLAEEYLNLSYHGLRAKDSTFNSDFKTDFDENIPKMMVVPQDFGRVLLNLINNAFYAANERSKKAEMGYEPKVIVSTQILANSQLLITIKDNGTGMSEATKAKIFQPFFTTKPTGQGTGLGLSLAYDIVTKGHGGTIEVESVEKEGTTFIVKLPIQNN